MNAPSYMAPPSIARWQRAALAVGVLALAISVAGGISNPTQFFQSYLVGFLFWLGIPLGCLAILMLQYLTGGDWGMVIRRPLEAATRTLPLGLLLFVPLAFGMRHVYEWTSGEALPPHKADYLTIHFFLVRAGIYFAIWLALAWLVNHWSRRQDASGDAQNKRKKKLTMLAGPGIILYGLAVSFAAVDWIMSLDPSWYSSIFGMLIMGGQLVSGMAMMIATLVVLAREKPMADVYQSRHFHDLGKLLFAFVMVWAYFSVSQLIIIWSGNLPEEIPWYTIRMATGWRGIGLLVVVLHFVLPFSLLLSRDLKQRPARLVWVAVLLLVARVLDIYWLTAPEFWSGGIHLHWMDALIPVGIGGIWLAYYARQLRQLPLLPLGERSLAKAIAHEAHS
ncbi:MAG TPA: hypothetical protein VEH50_07495 [Methylomirabilota bacterium]|nr:hypothetical protein [Methylomirabilota bacterium]